MANPKGKTDAFNRDLLDDGVLRPVPAAPVASAEPAEPAAPDAALARLRAEIQIGLDEMEAGLGKFYDTAEELFNAIMSDDEEEEAEGPASSRG